METVAILAGCLVGIAVAVVLFKVIFEDGEDFWSCVRYSLQPDLISLFRGEYLHDKAQSLKLSLWIILSVGSGMAAAWGFEKLFGVAS